MKPLFTFAAWEHMYNKLSQNSFAASTEHENRSVGRRRRDMLPHRSAAGDPLHTVIHFYFTWSSLLFFMLVVGSPLLSVARGDQPL